MACEIGQNVIACGSWDKPDRIAYRDCPACEHRRRVLVHYAGMWYGTDLYCLTCGGEWMEGDFRPVDPERRGERLRWARKRATGAMTRAQFDAYVHADVQSYLSDMDGAE